MQELNEPLYITSVSELTDFCQLLMHEEFIAIDTEFIRERTYYPQLCLIQIAGAQTVGVIDPLVADMDLSPLFTLLDNQAVKKVFHSARQDLEIFYHLMKKLPNSIYDTQIAAMVCGFGESVGYETLVDHLLQKKLDKSLRISNWAQRPLSKKQIIYAVGDVVYLREVYLKLNQQIERQNRQSWIEEEHAEMLSEEIYQPNFERQLAKLRLRSNNSHVLARAFELVKLRETIAEKEDKPRLKILRDEFIVELAHQNPQTAEDLSKIRTFSERPYKPNLQEKILDALRLADSLPEDQCPRLLKKPSKGPANSMVLEILKLLLKYVAKEQGVAERIIASSGELERLITLKEKDDSHLLKGWRNDLFGHLALKLLQGELHLTCQKNKMILTGVENQPE